MLEKVNSFKKVKNIWMLEGSRPIDYSDGRDIEIYLEEAFRKCPDLTSDSAILADYIFNWPTEYHLSPLRANLLRGFDLGGIENVLELGCGCGAITRYLGEQGCQVDAIEGSYNRSALAALRCRELKNVTVYNANFNELDFPDQHYDLILLVGVAEYAARFMDKGITSEEAVVKLLQKTQRSVRDKGCVCVAIENRLGMKYVLGLREDHYGIPYIGIQDYFNENDIKTFSLGQWQKIFSRLELSEIKTFLPFPDYKLPKVVLSREFVESNEQAYQHLEGIVSQDYPITKDINISEHIFRQAASQNALLTEFSNSFLFFLSRTAIEKWNIDFIHLPDFSRKPEYSVITKKFAKDQTVKKEKLSFRENTLKEITHNLKEEEYKKGQLLSVEWSRAILAEPESGRFIDTVKQYEQYLMLQDELFIDQVPWNIIVDQSGDYHYFDNEWLVSFDIDADYLIFRSLLYFGLKYNIYIRNFAHQNRILNLREFINHVAKRIGRNLSAQAESFVEREKEFQALVNRKSADFHEVLESVSISREIVAPTLTRIYWRTEEEGYSEKNQLEKYVDVSDETVSIDYNLPLHANNASYLRFDPCDDRRNSDVGFMRFYSIRLYVVDSRDKKAECVWSRVEQGNIAGSANISGLRFTNTRMGVMFAVTNDDPWFEFQIKPRRRCNPGQYFRVTVEVRMPATEDYLLAKEIYLNTEEKLNEKLKNIENLQKELEEIKSSRAYRYALLYWSVLYEKIRPSVSRGRDWLLTRESKKFPVFSKLLQAMGRSRPVQTDYEKWLEKHYPQNRCEVATEGPLISIITPVYDVEPRILSKTVQSVLKQTYGNWQLCIVDDGSNDQKLRDYLLALDDDRICIRFLPENRNISGASNAALEMAKGDFIAFLDNDDTLTRDTLARVAQAITEHQPDVVYTDEDFIKLDGHLDFPHFKPDYNPDLLLCHNYITHFLVVRRDRIEEVGGLRGAFDGAQDYDLVLRLTEVTDRIHHIQEPLYHWRMSKNSTSLNPEIKPEANQRGKKALQEALQRRNIDATVEDTELPYYFRVRRKINNNPLVSVIIPFKDQHRLLRDCVESILARSNYENYEILGISNDSTSVSVYEEMERLQSLDQRVRFANFDVPFNFSQIVNFGVDQAKGTHIILLNNDIEIISEEWIQSLLEHSQRPEVAAVGGKLYYSDNTVQHAGIMIGLGGYAGHVHRGFLFDSRGYFNRLQGVQNISAVTGAMMMVEKTKYKLLNGFDEARFAVAYNDVDFCLRAREAGYHNVFTPYAQAYHYESISRGYEDTVSKQKRFAVEMENLLERHGEAIADGDPYYNPNFDQGRDDFTLAP